MIDEQGELDSDLDVFEQPVTAEVPAQSQSWEILPSAMMLTLEEADELLCWRDSAIIAVVGEKNGGKTTLITELYGRFLRGPFANTMFCNSLSLLGFERKCYQSRAASGMYTPETPRTSVQDGLSFFHLAVSNESDLQRRDLLISERAGEVYKQIRDKPELAMDMVEICKATSIAFIVDGERVASSRTRHEVFSSVRTTIRALLSSGCILAKTQIQLVTTKYDLLQGEEMNDVRQALTEFEQVITVLLKEKFNLSFFHTSARNPKAGTEPGQGLAPLFQVWMSPKPLEILDVKMPVLNNEFDRLMLRRGAL